MAEKPKPKAKPKSKPDKDQSARFIETARELSSDESGEKISEAIDHILPTKGPLNRKSGHS